MSITKDTLSIKPNGEVANLILEFGWSCGNANPGILIHFERYKNEYSLFEERGGVLNKEQVKQVIKYLKKYVDKCDVKEVQNENHN